jgi:hypothetical protein
MLQELLGAAQSVQALSTLLKAANGLSNFNEIVAAVADVNTKLVQAQAVSLTSLEKQQSLNTRISELEKQIAQYVARENLLGRYKLFQFPTGGLAYCLMDEFCSVEPKHYLCATCHDKNQTSKLQPWGPRLLKCHSCTTIVETEKAPPRQPRVRSNSSWKTL